MNIYYTQSNEITNQSLSDDDLDVAIVDHDRVEQILEWQ